ncbi:signal peptidase I [Clostridium sp.]|uniref:signal peptidase I n=1 Tax=Clostridium sp. TaxID=1506 RepID=UPI00284EF46B|nr:signal peptidase I [Clostridium sp.]MDR3598260.1 signal peptidase I [Clostridium sp.]
MGGNSNKILNLSQLLTNDSEKNINGKTASDNKGNFVKEWIFPIIAAIAISILINKFLFFNVYVPTPSMVPTLNVKDKFVVTKVYNKENLKEGDIIVFHSNEFNERLVKRLIGLPGDKIEIKDGIVFRNGEKINEDYVKNKDTFNGTYEVPQGEYFFLGDNRPVSADSRRWKNPYVNASDIEGKVQFRYYPLKDFGSVK